MITSRVERAHAGHAARGAAAAPLGRLGWWSIHAVTVPSFGPELAALVGLGVGIDYALFVVTRYRAALHAGAAPQQAVGTAMAISGRAVVLAGSTVVLSLLGLFLLGLPFIYGAALGAIIAVLLVMAASLTLLPAGLGFAGTSIDRLRIGRRHRSDHSSGITQGWWWRWARQVQRRPWQAGAAGLAALLTAAVSTGLLAAAAPAAAQPAAGNNPATSTATRRPGPTERGKIVGWRGGNAVIYPTAGFFTNPQILAVGAVRPDGSFTVRLPARIPVDLLAKSTSQCATLRSSNPQALSTFTGNSLIYQHGTDIGDTHSGSTMGIASFTSFANGDTRSGYVYANRTTTLTGFCQRTITVGGATADFRQNFDLPLRQGWNPVVADFSIPQPGRIVANLKLGTGPHEKWYFFTPAAP